MSLVENEQTKLLATALNTAATSFVTVGILAPIAAACYSVGITIISLRALMIGGLMWFTGAVLLHIGARRVLRGLTTP